MANAERWEWKKARTEAADRSEKEQSLLLTYTSLHSVVTHGDVVECHTGYVEVSQTELMSSTITSLEGVLDRYRHAIVELTIACRQRVLPIFEESLQLANLSHSAQSHHTSRHWKLCLIALYSLCHALRIPSLHHFRSSWLLCWNWCETVNSRILHIVSVSQSTILWILLKWLTVMDAWLQRLILWPDHEALWKTIQTTSKPSLGRMLQRLLIVLKFSLNGLPNYKWGHTHGLHKNTTRYCSKSLPKEWCPLSQTCGKVV